MCAVHLVQHDQKSVVMPTIIVHMPNANVLLASDDNTNEPLTKKPENDVGNITSCDMLPCESPLLLSTTLLSTLLFVPLLVSHVVVHCDASGSELHSPGGQIVHANAVTFQ